MTEYPKLTERQINLIYKLPLFSGLTDEVRLTLLEKLDYTVAHVYKGETIIRQNTVCAHLLILLEGNLEVNIIDITGNYIKVENIIAPRAFATPHLFDDHNIYPATFSVIEDGVLLKATKDSVFNLISSNPELLKNFLRITGNCNACTVSRLRNLSYKSIRSRFVFYLFEHKANNHTSEMGHNQTQLANYIGVSRPALANEMSKMEKEGLIKIDGTSVKLLSLPKLSQYI